MPMTDFDIVGSYNNQRITNIDAERSINCFEYNDRLGKKPKNLIWTSGLLNTQLTFPGTNANDFFRSEFVYLGNKYAVVGTGVFLMVPTGNTFTITRIGSMLTQTGYVGVDANATQILWVDGVKGYVWDTSSATFTVVSDSNFPTIPIDCTQADGFMFVAAGETNTFVLSQLNDATNYTPLQLGAINSHPGRIQALQSLHNIVFIFAENFCQPWQNQGAGTNLPFRPVINSLIEFGTTMPGSVKADFDKLFFLSQNTGGQGPVMMIQGMNATPISTRALDFQIAQYAKNGQVRDATGITIKENGLEFYRLNFTAANHTFVYNISMSGPTGNVDASSLLWHEEEVLNGDRHSAQTHSYLNGINYYGAYNSRIQYTVDPSFLTNDGEAIRRVRITKAYVNPGYERLRVDRLQMDLVQGGTYLEGNQNEALALLTEDGFAINTEDGFNIILEQADVIENDFVPIIFLSISKDGGNSYGFRIPAPMGALGQRSFRTVWRKLGVIPRGQAFVAMFECFDPIDFVILGGAWSYETMPE